MPTGRGWRGAQVVGVLAFFLGIICWPYFAGGLYYQSVFTQMFIYIALAVSYQLLIGYARLVSFGHIAFYGLSAYTSSVLVTKYGVPFVLSWLVAIAVTVVLAFVVARLVIKLEPLLLAVATLAVAQIVSLVVSTLAVTGGQNGLITGPFTVGGIDPAAFSYWFVAAIMVLVVAASVLIVRSSLGRLLLAVGDDPVAARAIGTNSARTLTIVFTLSSALAGVAGLMLAQSAVVLAPGSIDLNVAITVLAMVAIGGLRSMTGAVIGAFLLTLIPVWFAPIAQDETLIYGGVLLVVFVVAPGGIMELFGRVRRRAGWIR